MEPSPERSRDGAVDSRVDLGELGHTPD
jgi:hypothetical protein